MKRFTKFILGLMAIATVGSTVAFSTWVNISNDITVNDTVAKEPKKAVCYNKRTQEKYTSLARACSDAVTNDNIFVIPNSVYTETRNVTIPSGVSVYVPFEGETWDIDLATYQSKAYKDYPFTAVADGSAGSVKNNLKSSITLGKNVTLTINGGLYLGAEIGSSGVARRYSQILLDEGASIILNNTFTCLGYVKEINGKYNPTNDNDPNNKAKTDNSNDANRFIDVKSGSTLNCVASILDLKSGSGLKGLVDANICPFSQFTFSNLQTYTKINYGANLNAIALLCLTKYIEDPDNPKNDKEAMAFKPTLSCIRIDGSGDSLFYFENNANGYFGMEYIPNDKTGKYTNSESDHLNFYCHSKIKQGYLKLDLKVADIAIPVNTSKYFLPINYRFSIYISNGSSYSTIYKVKFLNGSYLKNDVGGTVNILNGGELIFYEKTALEAIKSTTYISPYYSKPDAIFINNGMFNIATTTSKFGGKIVSDDGLGQGSYIKICSGTNWKNLSVTSNECPESKPVTVISKSTFIDSNNETAGKQVKSMLRNYTADTYYYKHATDKFAYVDSSNLARMRTLTVNKISDGGADENISYRIQIAPTNDSNNKIRLDSDALLVSCIFEIPEDFSAVADILLGTGTFSDGSAFANHGLFAMNQDKILNIKAIKTITINMNNAGGSGCGGMIYDYKIYNSQKGGTLITSGKPQGHTTFHIQEGYWMELTITIGMHNPFTSGTLAKFKSIEINGVDQINKFTLSGWGSGTVIWPSSAKLKSRMQLVPKSGTSTFTLLATIYHK